MIKLRPESAVSTDASNYVLFGDQGKNEYNINSDEVGCNDRDQEKNNYIN